MKKLLLQLDLIDFIKKLEGFFAREKSFVLDGDKHILFKNIQELDRIFFAPPPLVKNLDSSLGLINKFGTLKLDEIYEFIKIINYFKTLKKNQGILQTNHTKSWLDKINIPEPLEKITHYFDSNGNLNSGFFEQYDYLKQGLDRQKNAIHNQLKEILNSEKIAPFLVDSQIHLINQTQTLLLKAGFGQVIKGTILHRSGAGFFYLLPEAIHQTYQKIQDFNNLIEMEILKICQDISKVFNKHFLFLKFINLEFDKFDHIQARIFFAKQYNLNFILPEQKNKNLILKDFCHPILENPKPLNLDFSKQLLLITGPNAGGKTMLLKSILSSIFLSKYLVPFKINASHSHIPHFKFIEAIISDPQNSKNDISTFAGRMLDFSKILHQKDMILGIDEIELGTDADEAASLYKALLETLLNQGAKIVVTTHHKRLAALMANDSRIGLVAALYDEKKQKPKFDFLFGSIGKSYAFETAERYHIPPTIIQQAKEYYGKDKEKLNLLIEKSAELEINLKSKILEAENKIQEYEKKILYLDMQIQKNQDDFKNEKNHLQEIYNKALGHLRTEIKNMPQTHQAINNANKILATFKSNTPKAPQSKQLKINDYVKYKQSRGVILSISQKNNDQKCLIELETGMRLKVSSKELKLVGAPPVSPAVKQKNFIPQHSYVHLDLHGLRAEEAQDRLDKFISDSLIAGFDEVIVYHGIGTGTLSRVVKEFLRDHPRVVSFEDAPPQMGGFGAKIIRL